MKSLGIAYFLLTHILHLTIAASLLSAECCHRWAALEIHAPSNPRAPTSGVVRQPPCAVDERPWLAASEAGHSHALVPSPAPQSSPSGHVRWYGQSAQEEATRCLRAASRGDAAAAAVDVPASTPRRWNARGASRIQVGGVLLCRVDLLRVGLT